MHRQGEFVGDRHQDAAARRAVELGHHEAGDARDAAEDLDLAQRILPDRGVEHEQHRMRRLGVDLPHHPDDLFQLAHQLGAILQSPRGVHQYNVDAKLAGFGQRVEGEPGRVGALVALDEGGKGTPRPDAQLLDRRGAEGVARGEQDRLPLGPELGRELADRRRLAGAVDSDDEDNEWALIRFDRERASDGGERPLDLGREDPLDLVGIDPALVAPAGDGLADARRRAETEVGLDENVLEIVERSGVELALGEDVGDAPRNVRRRAREARSQPLNPARLRLRGAQSGGGRRRFGGRRGRHVSAAEPAAHEARFRLLLVVLVQREKTS